MISVADLINKKPLKGNYYAPSAYVQGDFELGLLETRQGARLISLPDTFIQGMFAGLTEELGQASGIVLYNCGVWWGKNFYRRFLEEVSNYYETSLAQMEMAQFISCFKQCWKTHGWGVVNFNFDYYPQGFICVNSINSPFAENAEPQQEPSCYLEAGVLSAFFSQLTGQELGCVQTSCESLNHESNQFIIGLEERLKVTKSYLEQGHSHEKIMELLCN